MILLAALAACGPLGINIFAPALPVVGQEFGAAKDVVLWTMTLYFVGISLGTLVVGQLSDSLGRRPVVICGILVYASASLGCFLADSVGSLIAGRFLQALGGCVGIVTTRAIVQDVFPRERIAAALSTVVMISVLVPMVAPGVGGYLTDWLGWRSLFLGLAAAAAALTAVCVRYLPETNTRRRALSLASFFAAYPSVLGHPLFLLHAMSIALVPSTFFGFMSVAPYLAQAGLGMGPSEYGTVAMILPGGFVLGNFVARQISHRLGNARMVLAGNLVTAASLAAAVVLVVALPLSPLTLFAPMVFVTFGHGLAVTNGASIALGAVPSHAGTSAALLGFFQMAAAGVLSQATSAVADHSPLAVLLVVAGGHAVGMILFLAGRGARRKYL